MANDLWRETLSAEQEQAQWQVFNDRLREEIYREEKIVHGQTVSVRMIPMGLSGRRARAGGKSEPWKSMSLSRLGFC